MGLMTRSLDGLNWEVRSETIHNAGVNTEEMFLPFLSEKTFFKSYRAVSIDAVGKLSQHRRNQSYFQHICCLWAMKGNYD